MVAVLVIGATGYIGLPTALALRRSGHCVYGLTRTEGKADILTKNEITPIIADATDIPKWTAAVAQHSITAIIDTTGNGPDTLKTATALAELSKKIYQPKSAKSQKLGYIYISGTWVNGSSNRVVDDYTVVGELGKVKPPELVSWRPKLEQDILALENDLDVVIVRPSMVFGGSGSIFSYLFSQILSSPSPDVAEVLGREDMVVSMVHKEDVASFLVAAVEKLSYLASLSYPIFNIPAFTEPLPHVLKAAAKALNFNGVIKFREPKDLFEEAILTNAVATNDRARSYTEWEPKLRVFSSDIEVYVNAIRAHLGK